MRLFLNGNLASSYKSASQIIRILSESWVSEEIYCPSCGNPVGKYEENRPVADFYCQSCKEDFELKSKGNKFGRTIVDGEYDTAVERTSSNNNPNLFLLAYDPANYEILNFFVVPKYFFTPEILEKRKPLSPNARRHDWVGCNIILGNIPHSGRIFYVQNKIVMPRETVLSSWQKTGFLRKQTEVTSRGWTIDVMNCIDRLGKKEFSLADMYAFERALQKEHPRNLHVKDKIRQQLQVLRDNNYLEFSGRGKYRIL